MEGDGCKPNTELYDRFCKDRFDHIDDAIVALRKAVSGNGKGGLSERLARVETKIVIASAICLPITVGLIGKLLYDLVIHLRS